jgi:hypothetical protein
MTTIIKRIKEIVALNGVYSESKYTCNRMQTPRMTSKIKFTSLKIIVNSTMETTASCEKCPSGGKDITASQVVKILPSGSKVVPCHSC